MKANVWAILLVFCLGLVFAFAGLLCLLRQLQEVLSLQKHVVERCRCWLVVPPETAPGGVVIGEMCDCERSSLEKFVVERGAPLDIPIQILTSLGEDIEILRLEKNCIKLQ